MSAAAEVYSSKHKAVCSHHQSSLKPACRPDIAGRVRSAGSPLLTYLQQRPHADFNRCSQQTFSVARAGWRWETGCWVEPWQSHRGWQQSRNLTKADWTSQTSSGYIKYGRRDVFRMMHLTYVGQPAGIFNELKLNVWVWGPTGHDVIPQCSVLLAKKKWTTQSETSNNAHLSRHRLIKMINETRLIP